MSNQRVVFLTDKAIRLLLHKGRVHCHMRDRTWQAARSSLTAALEHPGGITDDMVERSLRAVPPSVTLGCMCAWDEDGNPPANCTCAARAGESAKLERRRILEAALFPGDGERPTVDTITEWRAFVGDEGADNDYVHSHSREMAEKDLAELVAAETEEPYDHQGIECRQCGPWVEVSRTVGQVNG